MVFTVAGASDCAQHISGMFVDNFENNLCPTDSVPELSDLYPCCIRLRIKTPGTAQKSRMINFASLEHAFMYRMIRFPFVDSHTLVPDESGTDCQLTISANDASVFLNQFEAGGVFASWDAVGRYCNTDHITLNNKHENNIGLIARYLFSSHIKATRIRAEVVRNAYQIWLKESDKIALAIACCLKLGLPNFSSYRVHIRRLFKIKVEQNICVNNALYHRRLTPLRFSSRNATVCTKTRLTLDPFYNALIMLAQNAVEWRADLESCLALFMSMHPRVGCCSSLRVLHNELLLMILMHADPEQKFAAHDSSGI